MNKKAEKVVKSKNMKYPRVCERNSMWYVGFQNLSMQKIQLYLFQGKNHKIEVKILDSQKENIKKGEKNSVVYKNGVFLFNIHSDIQDSQDYYEGMKKLHGCNVIIKYDNFNNWISYFGE